MGKEESPNPAESVPASGNDVDPGDGTVPVIEDAYDPDAPVEGVPPEDDADSLDDTARSLDDDDAVTVEEDVPTSAVSDTPSQAVIDHDEESDTAAIADNDNSATDRSQGPSGDWEYEVSAQHVAVELKRIETEVRSHLEGVDDKRKRKLSGTRRWRELQEDLISWQHTGRIENHVVQRLMELIERRDYLFRRLTFLSRTRPGWNS